MRNPGFEKERLLSWLGEVLTSSDAVDVDIVVVDGPRGGSSVEIIVHNVPVSLAGLEVRARPPD